LALLLFLLLSLFKWDSQSDAAASRWVLTTHAIGKTEYKTSEQAPKKDQNLHSSWKKRIRKRNLNELFQNHVQQKFREKKKHKTTKEDCGSHQDWDSFELLTLKLTKVHKWVLRSRDLNQTNKRGDQKTTPNGTSFQLGYGMKKH
jgi:hypothetical protein